MSSKHIPSLLLGAAGFVLSVAACGAWASEPSQLTLPSVVLIGACILGGLFALKLPGFPLLPSSLPLVGAMAVTSGAPVAVVAGFGAGLATALCPAAPAPDTTADTDGSRWSGRLLTGWGVGGTLALGAGLAASGFSRLNLAALFQATPSAAAPQQVMRTALALLSMLFACWLVSAALHRQSRLVRAARSRAGTGLALVESIALAIEAKDRTSERHLRRMRIYTVEIGRRLGLRPEDLEALEYAALLHDIGKLVVPESILSKPAGLSTEEFQIMSTHARVGAEILETTSLPAGVVKMVRHHHERYDGSGYPDALIGLEIPLGARILAAVDTFEALTSQRAYRPGMSLRQAISYMQRNAGTLYDPRVVRVLVEHHTEFEQLVLAEETTRAGRLETSPAPPAGAATPRVQPPFQMVLDRIASSHMEIYSLHEITQALGKTLNIDECFSLIAAKIQRLIHFTTCVIHVHDPDREVLLPRFAVGAGASHIMDVSHPLGQGVSGWAALQRRTATNTATGHAGGSGAGLSDFDLSDRDPDVARLRSTLAAPLMMDDVLVGVVTLHDVEQQGYTAEEEQLLSLIARQVASAVRTGLLFEQTQEHALTDSLTGLPNSRYMFIAFDREAEKAKATGTPLTLVVMDIDRFQEINDDFGHHAGDRFLVGMARAIRSQMRVCDTCIRYAGDEFVAILPGLAGPEVDAVVARMTEAARDYCMEARPGRPVRLDLSIGCATMPADGDDFETLIAAADARMKVQKGQHRDRDRDGERPAGLVPWVPHMRRH